MENIGQQPDKTRRAHYAGMFYPSDPVELARMVEQAVEENAATTRFC
jgi:predicted class III extradiol MEMO1 family dioxygenase